VNIAEITPKGNYVLYIKTEDGEEGLLDVKPYLNSEAFAPLKNIDEFKRISNGKYFIEWECGADLSAGTIEARWDALSNENVQQVY
jgi:hypothetical protein